MNATQKILAIVVTSAAFAGPALAQDVAFELPEQCIDSPAMEGMDHSAMAQTDQGDGMAFTGLHLDRQEEASVGGDAGPSGPATARTGIVGQASLATFRVSDPECPVTNERSRACLALLGPCGLATPEVGREDLSKRLKRGVVDHHGPPARGRAEPEDRALGVVQQNPGVAGERVLRPSFAGGDPTIGTAIPVEVEPDEFQIEIGSILELHVRRFPTASRSARIRDGVSIPGTAITITADQVARFRIDAKSRRFAVDGAGEFKRTVVEPAGIDSKIRDCLSVRTGYDGPGQEQEHHEKEVRGFQGDSLHQRSVAVTRFEFTAERTPLRGRNRALGGSMLVFSSRLVGCREGGGGLDAAAPTRVSP